jgi:DNA-binding response OmpR family regulator
MMPMMDGWEFLEHQSRDFALMQIPVIVLTATPPSQPVKAKVVLQKPIQFDSLVKLLNQYLPAAASESRLLPLSMWFQLTLQLVQGSLDFVCHIGEWKIRPPNLTLWAHADGFETCY